LQIDTIYLFGDTRSYHQLAREVASRLSVKVSVFEEGYLRPHYVTLEEGGVNNRSSLSRDPDFYHNLTVPQKPHPQPVATSYSYCCAAWYAVCYYAFSWLGRHRFSHYAHHRPFNPLDEAYLWLRAGFRKYYYRMQQRGILGKLTTTHSGNYYLSPLQVHCDGQIRTCEGVASAAFFIRRTIRSFVRNAPPETLLVLKHHPLCRGYSDYTRLIQKLTRLYGCEDRVIYVHDLQYRRALITVAQYTGYHAGSYRL
jgi:capsular polysaccharide export protein